MFEIFFSLAFFSLLASIGAFGWYFARDRRRRTLWVAIVSLLAVPTALWSAFAFGFSGDEDHSGSVDCGCPEFGEAVSEIAWLGDTKGLPGTTLLTGGTRMDVDLFFNAPSESMRRRLVEGLAKLGAEGSDPGTDTGTIRTPLVSAHRYEVRATWFSDTLRIAVTADLDGLDSLATDLEPFRAVFGTVDDPLP